MKQQQPDLFAPITRQGDSIVPPPEWLARRSDPPTSKASALSVERFAGEQYARILWALKHGGSATIHELAERCIGLGDHQIGKRLPELEAAGKIRQTGETRPSPAGRQCRVWALTNAQD